MNVLHPPNVKSERAALPVEEPSDEQLMQAYVEGKDSCFAVLVGRYQRELFSYLRRMLVDATLAEDVFQNTFMQVHLKQRLYQAGRPFRPWLYTIATHQAIDALRRNRRHRRTSLDTERDAFQDGTPASLLDMLEAQVPDPHSLAEHNERGELVRGVVDRLADHLRSVVVLSYYQGMKYKEIAQILDIPVGTVKSRLHAAIQRLGKEWQQLGLEQA